MTDENREAMSDMRLEQLRRDYDSHPRKMSVFNPLPVIECIHEIDRLRAENAELRKMLRETRDEGSAWGFY